MGNFLPNGLSLLCSSANIIFVVFAMKGKNSRAVFTINDIPRMKRSYLFCLGAKLDTIFLKIICCYYNRWKLQSVQSAYLRWYEASQQKSLRKLCSCVGHFSRWLRTFCDARLLEVFTLLSMLVLYDDGVIDTLLVYTTRHQHTIQHCNIKKGEAIVG